MLDVTIREKIYVGVLGKLIGVYLGRPVEGWAYEDIRSRFQEIDYYVHKELDYPIIVADDDISGTFGFMRALPDFDFKRDITSQEFGKTWLNYIIENQTILWWGGLGRSTEHTAFLNLKNGIQAPKSGSIQQNGQTLAEQIGAQIFIDGIAMACPNDPELAVYLARESAKVSHDGIAVDAAGHLAAMEALAFGEKNIDTILDQSFRYTTNTLLRNIIDDVRNICTKESNFRVVRDYLNSKYGYHIYPGACHMVPNHAMVLASILLGKDDFQHSISIATNSAWDTDCNAGNVGAFNGIRLGLEGVNAGADFRGPVADRLFVSTADGGKGISDAVREADHIWYAANQLAGEVIEKEKRQFSFSYPGSTQGFLPDIYIEGSPSRIINGTDLGSEPSLVIQCHHIGKGTPVNVSAPVFIDYSEDSTLYKVIASPLLYSGQTVEAKLKADSTVRGRLYIHYYDIEDNVKQAYSPFITLSTEWQQLEWKIPDTQGMAIFKIGIQVDSDSRYSGNVYCQGIHWDNAPSYYGLKGMLMTSIWKTNPHWLDSFVSSARNFCADFNKTFCVSHSEPEGLVTIGTQEWRDYSVSSDLFFSLHQAGGLVARAQGHRRYYGAILRNWNEAVIYCRYDDSITELGQIDINYEEDKEVNLSLNVSGNQLTLLVNHQELLRVTDDTLSYGGAGYVISEGTFMADNFVIHSLED